MQVNAVIRVLMGNGNSVHGTIWPVCEQPWQRCVPKVQHQTETVPVHRESAARTARLWKGAATAEDGDLSHSNRMAPRRTING